MTFQALLSDAIDELGAASELSVPLIIITEPPPEDHWIAWNNATNNPQDFGYGRYLTVPSRSVSFVNFWPDEAEMEERHPDDDLFDVDPEETSSPVDTPAPGTPVLGSDDTACFSASCAEYDGEEVSGMLVDTWVEDAQSPSTCEIARPSCDIFAGEDDDLPPFDDWYLSIAARTNLPRLS
jgi:hypothetical protein